MKTFPYNKEGIEGRRLTKLLDLQYNPGVVDEAKRKPAFEIYDVPSVSQCRANKASFLFPSNLAGIQRPQVRVEADVELAWGDFAEGITSLDFTHGEELPLSYTQPIEDDTMKMLIDAGLYSDPNFELLISKLVANEVFDAEADLHVSHLDVGRDGEQLPVILVEPVVVVHTDYDPTERTNIADLIKRSARIAVELRKADVNMDEIVAQAAPEQDAEVFISDSFRDAVTERAERTLEQEADKASAFVEASDLLDREIDVTDQLKGSLGFDFTTEDDRIRDLKEREWAAEREAAELSQSEPSDVSEAFGQDFQDISNMSIEDLDDEPNAEEEEDAFER